MIEFLVLGEVRMVVSRTDILDLQAADFSCLRDRFTESLGKQCQGVQEGQGSSGRLESLQEGNPKGAGVGYLQVLKAGWNSGKKKSS